MLRLDPTRLPDHLPLTFTWRRGPFSATASFLWQRTGDVFSVDALFLARAPFRSFRYEARSLRDRNGLCEVSELVGETRCTWHVPTDDLETNTYVAAIETLYLLILNFEAQTRSICIERTVAGVRVYKVLGEQTEADNGGWKIRAPITGRGAITVVFDGKNGLPLALSARLPLVGEIKARLASNDQ